jgi:FkbM family methyltransferase
MLGANDADAKLARLLVANIRDFMLLDIGASGGIHPMWKQLGPSLQAHGIEPDIGEVERLNSHRTSDQVLYHAALVTSTDDMVKEGRNTEGLYNTHSFEITSARRASNAMGKSAGAVSDRAPRRISDRKITVDWFCENTPVDRVDFIKTDTDGYDYYVLRGAEQTLRTRGVLGVQVECPLHGTPHPLANTFANIDRYMREQGFALFDMDVWRYTRSGLPGVFVYDIPAQTKTGPVQWLDALYFLDPMTRRELFETLTPEQMVKLLVLYDLFGLGDCAATLMVEMRVRRMTLAAVNFAQALNTLAPRGDYDAYIATFDRDPTGFYASRRRRLHPRTWGFPVFPCGGAFRDDPGIPDDVSWLVANRPSVTRVVSRL